MEWIVVGINFAVVFLATPAVVAVFGNMFSMNAPTITGLIVRSFFTALIFAGGMALFGLIPISLGFVGMLVPLGLLMLGGFCCWGFEFPEDTTYAFCFALVIGVVRFAVLLLISGLAGG